jgi:hypothetical protein
LAGEHIYPCFFVYVFELMHRHHLVVIFVGLFGIKAFQSTFDAKWIQMNLILLFHVIFEGPIWFALISYRLQWQLATIFL